MGQTAAGLRSYGEIFRVPGAKQFIAAGFIGRMPSAMLSLGTVFLITAITDSYATAGLASAGGALCYALIVPQLGYLIDRFGQRRVLRPLAAAFGTAAALFLLAAQLDAPVWLLCASGAAFGAFMPPLGALVRARWSHLAERDEGGRLLKSAFSFESVADELIWAVGPLLVAFAVLVHPAAGVAAAALTGVTGCLLLAQQRGTEPPVAPVQKVRARAITAPGMPWMCAVYLFTGAMFAAFELATIAFVDRYGETWMTGAVLGTYAVGSAIGGLWYGARDWSLPLDRLFLLAIASVVAGMAPLWAMPGVPALWAISLFAGILTAPAIIAGYSLVREGVPSHMITEGLTWLSTAVGVGRAAGVGLTGLVIEHHGPRWAYALALGFGVLAVAMGLSGARTLRAMATARLTRAA
ncbi:MFS transporter [Streptomyces xiamenensis]